MTTEKKSPMRTLIPFALAMTLVFSLLTPATNASDPESDRLQRKVKVMQRVIDEVLVQSEHALVSPSGATRGLVLEGYGVLFTLEASLGEAHMFGGEWFSPEVAMVIGEDLDLRGGERIPEPGKRVNMEEWEAQKKQAQKKKQEDRKALKTELIDAMLDYGMTLSELDDENWVVIAAYLGSSGLFVSKEDEDQFIIRIKMRDLRRFMNGSLSRDEARAVVVVEG